MPEPSARRRVVVVSDCLLGRACRYNGGHKRVPGLHEALAAADCRVLSFCPETDSGLPVPRPPMDLHPGPDGHLRALRKDGTDCTPPLQAWIHRTVEALKETPPDLCILKAKSPSCGIHPPHPGLFAEALRRAFPTARLVDETEALALLRQPPYFPRNQ